MSFVIVCYHDRIRYLLCDHSIAIIFEREYDSVKGLNRINQDYNKYAAGILTGTPFSRFGVYSSRQSASEVSKSLHQEELGEVTLFVHQSRRCFL